MSCAKNRSKSIEIHNVKAEVISIENVFFGDPSLQIFHDSLIFIKDLIDENYFALIDVKNNRFIRRFGRIGRGPNEIITPSDPSLIGNSFVVNTVNSNTIVSFCINDIISSPVPTLDILIHLNSPDHIITQMVPLMVGNKFLASGWFSSGKFALVNQNGEIDSIFGSFPSKFEALSQHSLSSIFQSSLVHHPTKRKVASVTINATDLIEVISYNKRGQFEILSNTPTYSPVIVTGGNMAMLCSTHSMVYTSTSATERYIYILYLGRSVAEYKLSTWFGSRIHVYDWNLNKRHVYILDHEISSFVVSSDDRYLYSFGMLDENVDMLKWRLSN